MDDIVSLLGAGASVASGGLFGLFGSIVGQVSKHFQRKQEQKWEKEKWNYEADMFRLQMQAKAAETEQELAIVSQQGSWSSLDSSIKADGLIKPQSAWASDVKALFRPFITVVLVGVTAWIIHMLLNGRLDATLTHQDKLDIIRYSVYSVVFSTSTAITWWFADRALTPPQFKNR